MYEQTFYIVFNKLLCTECGRLKDLEASVEGKIESVFNLLLSWKTISETLPSSEKRSWAGVGIIPPP